MLSHLFSHRVLVEHMSDAQLTDTLYLEERKSLRSQRETRLQEFTLGRLCARKALARLGIRGHPIGIGKNREPLWPHGITGSISHCGNYCIVAVSSDERIASVGVDIERHEHLQKDITDMVCTTNEKRWLATPSPCIPACAETLIFSAKESVYKCLFPITKTFLEFSDLEITLVGGENEFRVDMLRPEICRLIEHFRLRGRFYCANGFIFTGLELEKPVLP